MAMVSHGDTEVLSVSLGGDDVRSSIPGTLVLVIRRNPVS
jgi:hypothetical protein